MIDCLIFSKNRACQLELLLRSIRDNFKELKSAKILYLATDKFYNEGYEVLKKLYPEHEWIKETNFTNDARTIFYSFKNEFLINFVDDEIVIRDTPIEQALNFLRLKDTHCISLRMAPHINYCYTANHPDPQPALIEMNVGGTKMFRWDWRSEQNWGTDWRYPSCINSHVYHTEDFIKYISVIEFNNANSLEGMFNNIRHNFKPFNACFEKSKTINIANNIIQTGTNRHGVNQEWQVENLNKQFILGKRLSTVPFYNYENTLATFEMDYAWAS